MGTISRDRWETERSVLLDRVEAVQAGVRRAGSGRHSAAHEIKQAYVLILSAQFQAFCRDLHSEAVDHLVRDVQPAARRSALREALNSNRKLDRGNPNPGNIGADFEAIGVWGFWPAVRAHSARNERRQQRLEAMARWRNAIAHADLDAAKLGGRIVVRLDEVRSWRAACHGLVASFESVVAMRLSGLVPGPSW